MTFRTTTSTIGDDLSRRRVLQLLGIGAGTALVAACAPSGGSAPAPAASTGSAAQDFSFASWSLSEEAAKPVITGQLDTFGADAGVTATPVSYPYNEYLNQLTLQTRGGEFSGAAQLDIAWLGTLAALGKLQDLSALAQGRGYIEAGLSAGQFDGVQYGLPWTLGAIGLVGNREILDRAGITDLPSDIAGFEEALRELKKLDDGLVPYAASTKVAQLKDVQTWMQTFGCTLVEDGRVTLGDDASVEAMTWYKRLYDDGLIGADVDRFDARSLFAQGKTALYDDAPVGRSAVLADSPDTELGDKLVPFARPVVSAGDDPRALAWGHVIVVVDGDGAGTAAEYARWVTSDEAVVVDYFEQLGLPPTTQAGLSSEAVASDRFISEFGERITATSTPSPFWVYPQYGQIDTAIAEQVQAALVGSKTPREAMEAARDEAQSLID
ncbi:sugar ABC transporter substrate-binding protein [Isoptericola chiayiensis]|uniref:Sugar ABC transporter substrate-binding protein n=1 Tax=Isoptericola chiayiensis TaxID=579446 RepID=A0ABP8YJX8_9MICO|nr:extracellular solute-binding protein [Isoptericola chiayiensis]NOW01402.1 multiple sugar transport system substrate-binding protein [Isoptericola chiayiensis]